jgi:Ca2+-binding RTX toxin-like protein
LSITDDTFAENAEDFNVELGSLGGTANAAIGNDSVTSTIDASDPVTFSLTGSATLVEGESGSYTVSMVGPAGYDFSTHPGVTVTLSYSAVDATGLDYTQVATVNIAAGQTSVTFPIETIDDYFEENSAENFTVSIANVAAIADSGHFNGSVAIGAASVTTFILDGVDAPETVTPTAPENIAGAVDTLYVKISGGSSIIEGGADNTYTVSLVDTDGNAVIALTGGVTVDLDFSGSASNADYTVSANPVTIPSGASSVTFTVTALVDAADAESFTVAVGNIEDNGVLTDNFEYIAADPVEGSVTTTILGSDVDDLAVVHESALGDGSGQQETVFDADDEAGQDVAGGQGTSVATGNLATNDVPGGVSVTEITDIEGATQVGGIITITDATGTLAVVATAVGATATGGAIGDFTYTLLSPVSNTAVGEDDVANQSFTYTYNTSAGATGNTAALTVAVIDDEPIASSVTANVPIIAQDAFDVAFVLDTSGSMGDGRFTVNLPDGTATTRFIMAQSAIKALAEEFFSQSSDVEIALVTFAGTGEGGVVAGGPFTTLTAFNAAVDGLADPTGGTDYEDGLTDLLTAIDGFNGGAGVDAAAKTLTYFISDGVPTQGDTGNPVGESGWDTFLTANPTVRSYAVGIGTGLTDFAPLDAIHAVDLDGSGGNNSAINVPDLSQLEAELLSTVPPSFGGSVLAISGVTTADFGADGGFVSTLEVELGGTLDVIGTPGNTGTEVITFTYDPTFNSGEGRITYDDGGTTRVASVGSVLTLEAGDPLTGLADFPFGNLLFDFTDGSYNYFAAPTAIEGETFTLVFDAEDGDGDVTNQQSLTVTLADATPIAVDDTDTLFSNDDTLIGNVITGLGTDGGVALGSAFTSFASQGEGVDYAVDGAMVTAISYRGVDLDFTTDLSSLGSVSTLNGDGTTFTVTVEGGGPIADVNGSYQIKIVNSDASEVIFGSTGYYEYTPPTAPVNANMQVLPDDAGTFFEDFRDIDDSGDIGSLVTVSAGADTVTFNNGGSGLGINNDTISNGQELVFDFSAYANGVNNIELDFDDHDGAANVVFTFVDGTTQTEALNNDDDQDFVVSNVVSVAIQGGAGSGHQIQDLRFTTNAAGESIVFGGGTINQDGVTLINDVTLAEDRTVNGGEYLTLTFDQDIYARGVEYVTLNFDDTDSANGSAIFYSVDGARLGSVTMDGDTLVSPASFSGIGSIQIIPNGVNNDTWSVDEVFFQAVPLVNDAPNLVPEEIEYTLSDFDDDTGLIAESDTATLALRTIYNKFYGTDGDDGAAGLLGSYYASNTALSTIAEAEELIKSNAPTAKFLATELNYSIASNNLGTGASLEEFLGSDAGSLTVNPAADTSRGIIYITGYITLAAGDHEFRSTSDDGYSLRINGEEVISFDGNRGFGTAETNTITIAAGGLQTIEIIYWDQGGGAALQMEHRVSGGTFANISDAITSTIAGTESNDFFSGQAGNDTFDGGGGADVLEGGGGVDILSGGAGNDDIVGGAGDDELFGNANDDDLDGGEGNDILRGGSGDDMLFGGDGADVLRGNGDDDVLYGNKGGDTLIGNDGLDILFGNEGDDILQGGAGVDQLIGGIGDDELTGGGGSDTFLWLANEQGTFANPTEDIIRDFSIANDVLDLSDLLQNEEDGASLDSYLRLNFSDQTGDADIDTEIQIDHDGGAVFQTTQTIVLDGVDLSAAFGSTVDEVLITALIDNSKLIIDT